MERSDNMLSIDGIDVHVVRKDIRNLNMRVHPPDGRICVSAPVHVADKYIRDFVSSKLNWIIKKQTVLFSQPPPSIRRYLSGELHYFSGNAYRLELVESTRRHEVKLTQTGTMQMYCRSGTSAANKEKLLYEWYRKELKKRIPVLIEKWEPVIGKKVSGFGIRKMKTRWGSCNIKSRRIWLNLELARRPGECLEYVIVHELVHLLERNHNQRFKALMSQYLPDWRERKALLD